MPSFPVKLWKSVKMIKFEYKHDSEAVSWWMEQNLEVLVIFIFWPKSHTRSLAENLKIDYYWSFSSFTVKIWKWLKLLNSYPFIKKRLVNHVYIRIWSSWLTFTVSQGMKAIMKISQFSRFLLRSEYPNSDQNFENH